MWDGWCPSDGALGPSQIGLFSPMVYVGPIGIAINRSVEGVLLEFPEPLSRSSGYIYYAGAEGIEPSSAVLETAIRSTGPHPYGMQKGDPFRDRLLSSRSWIST
jgi:hypothetical protein